MKFVFGPVSSRRLGRSLGVDPLPFKTCNHSCVYCQLGRTTRMCTERERFYRVRDILEEVETALEALGPDGVDVISLVGSGETALYEGMGDLIGRIHASTGLPVAVLTNGSLLCRQEVRHQMAFADMVLPSLDAADDETFRAINRPARGIEFEATVDGLLRFRKRFRGELWLECMLVQGLNDDADSLSRLAALTRRLDPAGVQINTPVRPPAETWVRAPSPETLRAAIELLGDQEFPQRKTREGTEMVLGEDAEQAVASIVQRHPMRRRELVRSLPRWRAAEIAAALRSLERCGRLKRVTRLDHEYWCLPQARFPAAEARPTMPRQMEGNPR